ncbi:Alpha-ketoglutarate permease [compost metagenome]
MTIIAGQLLALLTVAVLQLVLSEQDLKAWGWRVPFLIGALASIVVVILRRTMRETATEAGMKSKESGSLRGLMQHRRAVLLTFTITIGCSLYFYTFTAYMQKFLVVSVGIPAPTVSIIMASALVIFMLVQPVFGLLADKIGVRRNMILFGLLSTFLVIPLLSAIKTVQDPLAAFGLVLAGLLIAAFYTPVTGVLKADFYPPTVRALGVGLPYAVGAAMFGGSAEYVALTFRSLGMEQYFYLYVAVIGAITLVSALLMPDLGKHGYLDGDGKVEANIGVRKFMGRKTLPTHPSH